MTQGLWKKLFIGVTVLLVSSIILSGSLWYQLNTIKIQLNNITAQLNAVKPEMDSLKAEREWILSSYANLRRQIDLRVGTGQAGRYFITPDDPEISAKVQEIAGGYSDEELWKDYARLFQWTVKNIEYSLDNPTPLLPESVGGTLEWRGDFWRTPAETMRDGTGDCEDMSLMLASMLLNYNQGRFPVWIVGARNLTKAHIAVAILSENNQLSIFDPAGRYWTPFSTIGGFGSQDVPLAVDHWLTHLGKEIPDAQIYVAFSGDFYQEFSSTKEFVDWVSNLLT